MSKSSDRALILALEIFTSTVTAESCNGESKDILETNDHITDCRAHTMEAPSIVIKLVSHYARKHARECNGKYIDILKKKYEKLDRSVWEKVHFIADQL